MVDPFGRKLDCLRISVTDRCDLRCRYCMPPEGIRLIPRENILSFEEIVETARAAVGMGITRLRITGGEPLVRPDIAKLVKMLAEIPGIEDLAMTTNGTFLSDYACALAGAGLRRVNVSLDATDADRYREITCGGDVRRVIAGIEAARNAGLEPIKLNCVVGESSTEPDAQEVALFARRNGLRVRFIRRMEFATGTFSVVEGGKGGDCARCSRLRLSSEGFIRPCLFSDLGFSVRELGPERALEEAVRMKPKEGAPCTHNWIRGIGG